LRRILAARKKPVPVRIRRRVAAAFLLCFVANSVATATQEISAVAEHDVRPIQELGTAIAPHAGDLPPDLAQARFDSASLNADARLRRDWPGYAYFWQASNLSYRPLYFEEPRVERYGARGRLLTQPVISGAHFFSAVPALPLKMAMQPPWRCVYPLGYARPGSDSDCRW
jgi:hypothetical protein